jgi:nitrogen fixation protein NifU and related proteins
MGSLSSLYQDTILDHNRSPRNYGRLKDANRMVEGHNPLCGDQLTLWLQMDGEQIQDVAFEGSGCAISRASASIMTGAVKGKSRPEAEALFEQFRRLVTGTMRDTEAGGLGKLAVFSGVSQYPIRVKCASLAWHALKAALEQGDAVVSTE